MTPQQPHQQPNAPGVDSGAIGRLTEAERAALATVLPESEWDYDRDRLRFEMQRVVEVVLHAHVTAALAEVESRIEDTFADPDRRRPQIGEFPSDLANDVAWCLLIVRDYREGVGR